jgi:glycogen(starch) synthase
MPALLLLTPDEWSRDPRAQRAAVAATARGWRVVAVDVSESDTPSPQGVVLHHVRRSHATTLLKRAGLGGPASSPNALFNELRGLFRLGRTLALSIRMIRALRGQTGFDIVHANDIETLLAAGFIARKHGARLVYDAHEIYSDQEPNAPRFHRYLSLLLEERVARHCDAVITVSDAIADELQKLLGLRTRPTPVLSCPVLIETRGPRQPSEVLRVVYQGAMGPGRQLNDLIEIADQAAGVHLTIRVVGADLAALTDWVEGRLLAERVSVLPPVSSDALVEALGEFDVGLIINRPVTRNDELVLPNKLFEYMMAGLAVVAPRLPSLALVIDGEGTGWTFDPGSTADAARLLTRLANSPETVQEMRRRAREAAVDRYNAEAQRPALYAAWGL